MAALRKVVKPLSKDRAKSDQDPAAPYHMKNGITVEKVGTMINEPGFAASSIQFPQGYTVIGVVPTDRRVIFVLSNNLSTEIGAYDPKTDTYQLVVNDPKFGSNTQKYFTGRYRYNSLSQLVIALTDNLNNPWTINIDSPADPVSQFEQFSLFPVAHSPTFRKVQAGALVVPGGSMLSGTCFVLVKYRNADYSETNYEISSQAIFIPGSGGIGAPAGTVTDWKIQLMLDNVDTSYDRIVIGLYAFGASNVATFNEIQELPIPKGAGALTSMNIIVTGAEAGTPLDLSEASVDTSWYDRIKTMTDLNDVLYIANLYRHPSYPYQSLANQITVKYISTTQDMHSPQSNFSDPGECYTAGSFRHNEVYALYIAFHYIKGGYTRAFHIPGRAPVPSEMQPSTSFQQGGALQTNPFTSSQYPRYKTGVPAFKVEDTSDTAPAASTVNGNLVLRGQLGFWQNNSELYPPDPVNWGALAGQPVRHHRFPSIRKIGGLLNTNFPGNYLTANYGKFTLDTLGIEVDNVQIPPDLASVIDGYQVYYAKRTLSNSCVIAQSLYMCGTRRNTVDQSIRSTGCNSLVSSNGGNRVTQRQGQGNSNGHVYDPAVNGGVFSPNLPMIYGMEWLAGPAMDQDPNGLDRVGEGLDDINIDYNFLRFHSFDLLSQKSPVAVNPDYIWNDFSYPYDHSFDPAYYGGNYGTGGTAESPSQNSNILLDVFNDSRYGGLSSVFSVANFDYTKSSQAPLIVPNSSVVRNLNPSKTYYVPNHTVVDEVHNLLSESCLAMQLASPGTDPSTTAPFGAFPTAANYSMLTSLMRVVDDAYYGFSHQSLASCGDMQTVASSGVIPSSDWQGADTNIAFYGFNTYTGDVIRLLNTSAFYLKNAPAAYIGDQIGARMTHYFLGEFAGNPQLRHEDLANVYSKYYPRSKGAQTMVKLQRSVEPNQIQYNHDYSRDADIRVPLPYDPYFTEVNSFPYRIARGGRQQAEARRDNWRSFLPLDYYESSKNFGPINNLGTYDYRLIIHHKFYARITKDRATLTTSSLNVVLGSGDIFDIDPTTPVPYEHGFGGTSHNLGCYSTPAGYIFLDGDKGVGNAFLYDGKLKSINEGLVVFLRDYLEVADQNTYLGNGIMLAYDPKYRRVIITVKNKKLPAALQPLYAGELTLDTAQLSSLIPGQSIVQYQGQYYTYIS